jgi:acyl transferase domain-containing protein/acyl carrier protein
MSTTRSPEDLDALSPLKRALLALTDMQARLDAESGARNEPIAIIGMGCRFPGGAGSPQAFWQLLRDGVDGISEVPSGRWDVSAYYDPDPAAPGKMSTRLGGFLDRVDQFDNAFFGISPREALAMDPQQRILLEVAWEALEDAGQSANEWSKRPAGVFMGVSSSDYLWYHLASSEPDPYMSTGNSYSIVANRLSYVLDFRGPSLSVDTACSSALVAVHLACQSLRNQESHLALAGGVNLVLSPWATILLSKYGMLAADGRCKTFDASADGYGRSEGCGVVVLKRLSDALAANDNILAVIRGSAVNQDGRSNGLTAPNMRAQQKVIQQALAQAGVPPQELQYIETHGTGTPLGDPIEIEALKAVLGPPQEGRECVLGSVKANIGHTEAAAGIAGLIKLVLAMQHEMIPPRLHFHTLNPHINLAHSSLVIDAASRPWPRNARPRFGGVSSFGFGGTNAHVVLEEAPEPKRPEVAASAGRAYLLPLSARSPEALTALARAYHHDLDGERAVHDVCYTASVKRNHHAHRLAVVGRSSAALVERLRDLEPRQAIRTTPLVGPVFIFGGQGEQWPGMGRELLAQEPVFRVAMEECEALVRDYVEWSLTEELFAEDTRSRLTDTEIAQPLVLALQVGLARLWRSWGIEPAAVVGHSVGEIAAAHVAGVLSLADAVKVAVHRGRLMQRGHGQGAMLAVDMMPEEAAHVLDGHSGDVSIAAMNGPTATVLSGSAAALHTIAASLQERGITSRELKAPYAFHHPHLAPLATELEQELHGLPLQPAALPIASTLTGRMCEGGEFDAHYWGRQLCEPVRFADAATALAGMGHDVFLEISPHPVLGHAVTQGLAAQGRSGITLASLRRNRADREVMFTSLGRLYELGYTIAWPRLYPEAGQRVPLPAYPWQHKGFWPAQTATRSRTGARTASRRAYAHPLLAEHFQAANSGAQCWQTDLDPGSLPYLTDHRVRGAMVFPAAAYVEMALAASAEALGEGSHTLEEIAFSTALFIPEGAPQTVQLVIGDEKSGSADFQLLSHQGSEWLLHATGTIRRHTAGSSHRSPEELRARCVESVDVAAHYEALRTQGLEYGPSFRGVQQIWRRDGEAVGRLQLPVAAARDAGEYRVHPALLDAGFQLMAAAVPRDQTDAVDGHIYLPVRLASVRSYARPSPGAEVWGHLIARSAPESTADTLEGDLFLMDGDGQVLLEARGLCLQRLKSARSASRDDSTDWLYETQWQAKTLPQKGQSSSQSGRWLILSDRGEVGKAVGARLEAQGEAVVTIVAGEFGSAQPEEFGRLLQEAFGDTPPRGLIHLWSLDAAPTEGMTIDALEAAQELGSRSVLHLVQALKRTGWRQAPRLWLITRCAQAVGPTPAPINVSQSPIVGLGRVIAIEHPELCCTEVDLGPEEEQAEIAALVAELAADDVERQVALRGEIRYAARLAHWSPETAKDTPTLTPAGDQPFRLESDKPGILDHMCLRATTHRPPGPGEVEIQVAAAALNFNDVLKALGLYPDLPPGPVPLGSECAGTIVAVGPGVEGLTVGLAVFAIAEGSIGTFVTTPAPMVAPTPPGLTMEEAATLPIVFMTVVYALKHLARLAPGERVLIHAAAGGVGLAAIQVAKQAGAEIFATAGTPEKRALLESLGVRHVMDSRSLAFVDEVMARTGGRGVDVVLNSLAGELMVRSLGLLAPYGRFLELGKRDLYENRRVGLWPFRKGVSYLPVDLAGLALARPAQFHDLWREVTQEMAAGVWQPLRHQVFPIHEAVNAFREMARGKHIGKIVLSMRDVSDVLIAPAAGTSFNAEGSYLITGGLGGLGLQVAQWMVERGARHLTLVGRRDPSESARAAVASLQQAGAQVAVVQADVSSSSQMAQVLAEIDRDVPPLRGIIHAAGVIDDGLLLQQDWERFTGVLAPKVAGAWNLHTLTLGRELDFFVMFSSMAAVVGSIGQGSYAAANAFLDGLAAHRRAQGLSGLSINWGPWAEVGMAASHRGVREQTRLMGVRTIAPEAGLQILERLLSQRVAQIGVMPVDWGEFPSGAAVPSLLADVISQGAHADSAASRGSGRRELLESLFKAAPEERQSMLETYLREQLAQVLGSSASELDVQQPLANLGIDSLMAVELRTRIQTDLSVVLPIENVLEGPSLRRMATLLLEQLTAKWLAEAPTRKDANSEWEVLTV